MFKGNRTVKLILDLLTGHCRLNKRITNLDLMESAGKRD